MQKSKARGKARARRACERAIGAISFVAAEAATRKAKDLLRFRLGQEVFNKERSFGAKSAPLDDGQKRRRYEAAVIVTAMSSCNGESKPHPSRKTRRMGHPKILRRRQQQRQQLRPLPRATDTAATIEADPSPLFGMTQTSSAAMPGKTQLGLVGAHHVGGHSGD